LFILEINELPCIVGGELNGTSTVRSTGCNRAGGGSTAAKEPLYDGSNLASLVLISSETQSSRFCSNHTGESFTKVDDTSFDTPQFLLIKPPGPPVWNQFQMELGLAAPGSHGKKAGTE
jgi:hypothetical protein